MGFLAAENQPCSLQSQTPSLDGLSRVWISDTILSGSVTKRKYIPEPHSRVASPAHMQSEPVLICDQGILGLRECGQQNGAAGMSHREFQCSNAPQTWLKDFANLKTTLPSFVWFFLYKITSLKWFLRCHHGRTGLMLFPFTLGEYLGFPPQQTWQMAWKVVLCNKQSPAEICATQNLFRIFWDHISR